MKYLNRVHLGGLRAIESVGRLGSLKAAAGELGVTVGAVSQKIQKAEAQLGIAVFDRRARALRLSPIGERIHGHLGAGLAELAAAVRLAGRESSEVLTVSVAPVFAEKWLVWRLKSFNDAWPDIRVRVDATMELVDPNLSDVDIGIRIGGSQPAGVRADKLLDHRIFPVCAPAIAEQLMAPSGLEHVPVIRDASAMFNWDVWLSREEFGAVNPGTGPTFSNGSLCLDAAIAGQGVFLAWETLAADSLAMGSLVAPFPGRVPTGLSYWLITARSDHNPLAVARFSKWLRDELDVSINAICLPEPV